MSKRVWVPSGLKQKKQRTPSLQKCLGKHWAQKEEHRNRRHRKGQESRIEQDSGHRNHSLKARSASQHWKEWLHRRQKPVLATNKQVKRKDWKQHFSPTINFRFGLKDQYHKQQKLQASSLSLTQILITQKQKTEWDYWCWCDNKQHKMKLRSVKGKHNMKWKLRNGTERELRLTQQNKTWNMQNQRIRALQRTQNRRRECTAIGIDELSVK